MLSSITNNSRFGIMLISDKFIFDKAKERLKTGEYSYDNKYYYSTASNLYYTLFLFMYSVLGKPETKKGWEHKGISEYFSYAL